MIARYKVTVEYHSVDDGENPGRHGGNTVSVEHSYDDKESYYEADIFEDIATAMGYAMKCTLNTGRGTGQRDPEKLAEAFLFAFEE